MYINIYLTIIDWQSLTILTDNLTKRITYCFFSRNNLFFFHVYTNSFFYFSCCCGDELAAAIAYNTLFNSLHYTHTHTHMCVLVSDLLSKTGLSEFGCLLPLGVDSHFWLPAWFPCTPFRVHGVWDNQAGSQKWIPTRNASNPLNSDNPIVETKSNTRKHMHTPTQCKIFTRIFWYWKTYKILVNMPLVFFLLFF